MPHLLHRGKLCGLAFAPITFWVNVSFFFLLFFPPPSGYDSASQFLVPGILIAVGMLLLVIFVVLAVFCLRWEQGDKGKEAEKKTNLHGKKTLLKQQEMWKKRAGETENLKQPWPPFYSLAPLCSFVYTYCILSAIDLLCAILTFFSFFFLRLWNSSDTKQRLWFLSLTQLKAILLIRTFSWGFIVWVNSVGCHHGGGAREKVHRSG